MLDDPRMTNSTFIEGYAFDGSLHYAPYTNDPRVSHAHGWATGPTSTLTFYIGGIRLLSAGGRQWEMAPKLGDLSYVDTGFETSLGVFETVVNGTGSGTVTGLRFSTPSGTTGRVVLDGVSGVLRSENGTTVMLVNGEASNVPGGTWTLVRNGGASNGTSSWNGTGSGTGSAPPEQQTGGTATAASMSMLAVLAGVLVCFL